MRICRTCNKDETETKFYLRGGGRNQHQADCASCSAKRAREYRQLQRDKVGIYKMEKGCETCGFQAEHPCQLDLDHIDPATKTYKGSHKSYDAGWSWSRIELELAKCTVTCKNCHSLRTYREGHWVNDATRPVVCDSPAHEDVNCE